MKHADRNLENGTTESKTAENKTGVIALCSAMVVTLLAFAAIATSTALAQEAEVTAQQETVTIVQSDCGDREQGDTLSSRSREWRNA